ncbi:hypothetical protein [Cupriavidus basilensis]|uniref:hypothetical protein n=1 Tax=Cupriavidus basilensis TaxID=68895 RepID=UPI0009E268E7|nr:hypothetical protein [Cupriavidus basilensis]
MLKAKVPVSRSPRGVLTSKPIYTRLLPAEQCEFEARALEEGRSLSNMARVFILVGMQAAGNSKATQGPAHQQTTSVEGD